MFDNVTRKKITPKFKNRFVSFFWVFLIFDTKTKNDKLWSKK